MGAPGEQEGGQGTHLSKGSSMTLQTVVDITPTIPRLREMRKSWYEFGVVYVYKYETM
jgi:hypothetical protein